MAEKISKSPLKPKRLLNSGILEGVEIEKQAVSREPNPVRVGSQEVKEEARAPGLLSPSRPTPLYQESHWGKLDKACTTSI